MTKPIFLVGLPNNLPTEAVGYIQSNLDEKLNDYHTIIYLSNREHYDFKCFYEKDFNSVKYEELKAIVRESLNKLVTNK